MSNDNGSRVIVRLKSLGHALILLHHLGVVLSFGVEDDGFLPEHPLRIMHNLRLHIMYDFEFSIVSLLSIRCALVLQSTSAIAPSCFACSVHNRPSLQTLLASTSKPD